MTTKTSRAAEAPVPCPRCGKTPETVRTGSYWVTRCNTSHMLSVAGHVMKTKREAIRLWNVAHGPRQETKESDTK